MSKKTIEKAEPETNEAGVNQERLNWRLAWRDDERVAQVSYAGEDIEEMPTAFSPPAELAIVSGLRPRQLPSHPGSRQAKTSFFALA